MTEKCFTAEFDKFRDKLKNGENLAFARFSDGELFMLKNQMVVLGDTYFVTGGRVGAGTYTEEERKEFYPEKHQKYREKLTTCMEFNKKNYFKGICTKSDVPEEDFDFQLSLHDADLEHVTFANIFLNNNYKRYIEEIVPLFKDRQVIYIHNKLADLAGLPFKVKKSFEIGSNCMIDDYDVSEKVKNYIKQENIKDHLILCSAASLSNFIIKDCFEDNDQNTFLDIGSTLNPYLNLEGWKHTRGYLTHYWLKSGSPYGTQIDKW